MSLTRRPNSPYWHFDFTIDGRRFRGSTGRTTRREAARVEDEEKQAVRAKSPRRSHWRLRDTFGAYWNDRAQRLGSADTVFARLEHLSRLLGKDKRTTDLVNSQLLDYRARRRGEGVTDSTVNRELAILKAAIRHATAIHAQPAPILAWGALWRKEPEGRTRYATRDDFGRLMAVAHPAIRPILLAAVLTGLRKATLLKLDWRQVDLDGGWIHVVGKGGKRHAARIMPPLKAALTTGKQRSGRVFDVTNFRKRYAAALAAAGIADFTFHDLRHTFGTWARMAGADILDLKEALNHADIKTTMRYAHVDPDEHVTAFDRVAERFAPHSTAQRGAK